MWPQLTFSKTACHLEEKEAQEQVWARTWRAPGAMECSTQKVPSSFPGQRLLPSSSPQQHLLSQDSLSFSHKPDAHLFNAGPPYTLPHSHILPSCHLPPSPSCSKSSLIYSLWPQTLGSRCLTAEQRTCSCPCVAEGSIPSPLAACAACHGDPGSKSLLLL